MSPSQRQRLIAAARRVATNAYAPYSRFQVGAAVLADNGHTYSGTNVENSSYSLTICAERAAIVKAVAAGCREIRAIVVFAQTTKLTPPCGACLQVIHEFGPDALVILTNGHEVAEYRVGQLLPLAFRLK